MTDQQCNDNCAVQQSEYSRLSTKALKMILRQDAFVSGDDGLDPNELLDILSVLEEREGDRLRPAEEAFKDFEARYLNPVDGTRPKSDPRKRWLRYAATIAALFAVVFIGVGSASSFEFRKWDGYYIWEDGTFRFNEANQEPLEAEATGQAEQKLFSPEMAKIQQEYGFPEIMLPANLPEGFIETKRYIRNNEAMEDHFFEYRRGKDYMMFAVVRWKAENETFIYQISDGYLEIREINGIGYYIFKNKDIVNIVWRYDDYECCIYGVFSMDEVDYILNSI